MLDSEFPLYNQEGRMRQTSDVVDRTLKLVSTCAVAVSILAAPLAVFAQAEASGSWKCKNDNPNAIATKAPISDVKAGDKKWAVGDAQAVLAFGGPTGAYIWAHWHGVRNDRAGSTAYNVAVMVRDAGGYYYAVVPRLSETVKGVADKPDRHRHCFGQFNIPEDTARELKKLHDKGVALVVEVEGNRDNQGWAKDLEPALKDAVAAFLSGKSDGNAFLKQANSGKTPASR